MRQNIITEKTGCTVVFSRCGFHMCVCVMLCLSVGWVSNCVGVNGTCSSIAKKPPSLSTAGSGAAIVSAVDFGVS